MSQTATPPNKNHANTTSAFGRLDTTTSLRPAHLQCPECAQASPDTVSKNLKISVVEKVDFHCCQDCGGAWFQDKGVDEALSAASEGQWTAPTAARSADAQVSAWACPCCKGNLVSIDNCQSSGVRVRRCLVCYGGWIEHSELLKAKNASRGALTQVGRFVRRLFR